MKLTGSPETEYQQLAPGAIVDYQALQLFPEDGLPRRDLSRRAKIFLGGAMVTGIATISLWVAHELSGTGEVEGYHARHPLPEHIDNQVRVASWNMHDEAALHAHDIDELGKHYNLDVIALQEVSGDDARQLRNLLPRWNQEFVMADAKQRPFEGGYGDVILTRKKPGDVTHTSFKGTDLKQTATGATTGFVQDIASVNFSFPNTKDGRQETRAALALTIAVDEGGKIQNLRFITAHIAGNLDPSIHQRQFKQLFEFIRKNTKSNTIFCGDLNTLQPEVTHAFADIGYITPQIDTSTLVTKDKVIDHCAYRYGNLLDDGHVRVLKQPATDHYPIVGSFTVAGIPDQDS